jgi:hypothetical protein
VKALEKVQMLALLCNFQYAVRLSGRAILDIARGDWVGELRA